MVLSNLPWSLNLERQAVVRDPIAVGRRQLDRAMGEKDRPVGGCEGFLDRKVAARGTVAARVGERRLAHEEGGAAGELGELFAGRRVAGVREDAPSLGVSDAEAV